MTSPAAFQQLDAESDPGLTSAETVVVAAVTVFLASNIAVTAVGLPTVLVRRMATLGLSVNAIRAAARLTLEPALTGRTRWGSPVRKVGPQTMVRRMAAAEPGRRARYLLNAAKRLTQAGRDREFTAGLRREAAYLAAHRRAGLKRARVAREYDRVARGQTFLKWRARMDSKTTPDCAAKNGTVWNVNNPPFPPPGAQHPSCRCVAAPLGRP